MNILGTEISLKHKAFEIYLAGCIAPHCPGCHNPESWDFSAGTALTPNALKKLIASIEDAGELVKNIWIMGGEPLHQQKNELMKLLKSLEKTDKDVWLFTRYQLEDVDPDILEKLNFIKCGAYMQDKASDKYTCRGIPLASTNQYIVALWEI